MNDKQIKLPDHITAEHKSENYLRRLIGRSLIEYKMMNNIPGNILELTAISHVTNERDFPDKVRYATEFAGEITLDWIVAVALIEGGYARDNFGFEYEIVKTH